METKLNPYINFKDNTRQAMQYYQNIFGGKLTMNTFKEFNASEHPSEDNKIMHAQLETDDGITIMASDTPDRMEYNPGTNYSMSLSGDDESELTRYFKMLAQDGTVTQPLQKATWGDTFGMVTDQFGVSWMVNINGNPE